MDISVIIPIYNVENYIEESLPSYFNQTKLNGVEFILVNDGSTDSSMQKVHNIIAKFPHVTTKIIDSPQGYARQQGIENMYNKAIATNAYVRSERKEVWQAIANPVIFPFTTTIKPWNKYFEHPFTNYFLKYKQLLSWHNMKSKKRSPYYFIRYFVKQLLVLLKLRYPQFVITIQRVK